VGGARRPSLALSLSVSQSLLGPRSLSRIRKGFVESAERESRPSVAECQAIPRRDRQIAGLGDYMPIYSICLCCEISTGDTSSLAAPRGFPEFYPPVPHLCHENASTCTLPLTFISPPPPPPSLYAFFSIRHDQNEWSLDIYDLLRHLFLKNYFYKSIF
jgi:hypothetical protein